MRVSTGLALSGLMLTLTACGQGEPTVPAGPPVPDLTDAQRVTLLAALPAPYDQASLENGRVVFARCRSCHTITPDGPNMTGPNLYGIIGRRAGSHPGYNYSTAVKAAGFTWDDDHIDHWLQNPRTFLSGNKMTYPGLPDATDRRDVIAFLSVEAAKRPVVVTAPEMAPEVGPQPVPSK